MSLDHDPIPRETLPPGWGPAEVCEERVAYRRLRPEIELLARRTEPDRSHLALGVGHCWELRYRHFVGEAPVRGKIGRVSTRDAVRRGLLECMDRVNDYVEDAEDMFGVESALEAVSLENFVPERDPSSHG